MLLFEYFESFNFFFETFNNNIIARIFRISFYLSRNFRIFKFKFISNFLITISKFSIIILFLEYFELSNSYLEIFDFLSSSLF